MKSSYHVFFSIDFLEIRYVQNIFQNWTCLIFFVFFFCVILMNWCVLKPLKFLTEIPMIDIENHSSTHTPHSSHIDRWYIWFRFVLMIQVLKKSRISFISHSKFSNQCVDSMCMLPKFSIKVKNHVIWSFK